MAGPDDTFDEDKDDEAYAAEQEEHAEEIREMVLEYLDDNDVDEATVVYTMLDLALSITMSGYAMSVEKPSVQGLRMELDRFAKDFGDAVRDAKKNADQFLEEVKTSLEAANDD
ncbi:hypothetical protein [Methyloraptor flagellatus]|jgi:hypothetical protein|uniref:Uncharacterized protein n=1 Tax=Methyloraptor flagellatus TaxID=3162530 RepID=A0AAU7XBR2_9HYPH